MSELRFGSARFSGIFLQARLGSTRLRDKVLLPLGGLTVIEHAMLALRRVNADAHVVVTEPRSEESLRPLAHRCGFLTFIGSEDDVLARFADAARYFNVDRIVRATGDNPLVSYELTELLMAEHRRQRADFSAYAGAPLGVGVEIVETEALLEAHRDAVDPYEREHVNPFLYRRPERFTIRRPQVPGAFAGSEHSVTLDTDSDYAFLTELYKDLYRGESLDTRVVLDWLKKHPRSEVTRAAGDGRAVRSVG